MTHRLVFAATFLLVFGLASAGNAKDFWTDPDPSLPREDVHSRFAELARDAADSVVNVHTSKTVSQPQNGFPDIFRMPGNPNTPGPRQHRRPSLQRRVPSMGTGFVISSDGHILTNHHVIDGVDEIEVRFRDGTSAKAEVVGEDPKTDLALIRVTGVESLKALVLGDSEEILPGDWVVAIGNPFGLSHTVTVGIVSAKGRRIGHGPYDDYIQTDAAINPGNSGGPLLNVRGEVIGINTAINPVANTIGFAVPVNLAKSILSQLRDRGHVERGWLGVGIQAVNEDLQEAFDLPDRRGALVSQVSEGSPADDAGLQRGDVIIRFDGKVVEEMRELPGLVSVTPIGKKLAIEVLRKGEKETLQVKIGRLEDPHQLAGKRGLEDFKNLGFEVQDPTPALLARYGLDETTGVIVTAVQAVSPAEEAGLVPGDVILEAEFDTIEDAADLRERLGEVESAVLLISRGDSTVFTTIRRM